MSVRMKLFGCVVALLAVGLCGCSGGSGGSGGGNTSSPLAGTWSWASSTWSGGNVNGLTFDTDDFVRWGATVDLTILVESDGSFTATGQAKNVTHGSVQQTTQTGTWTAADGAITAVADGKTATIPYTLTGNTLTLSLTTDQMLAYTGEALPGAYGAYAGATVVLTLTR